jgi:hypothetical protein
VDLDAFMRDGYVVVRGAFGEDTAPRLMAQPGVSVPGGFPLDGSDPSPVARAIVRGLATAR